MTEDEKLIQKLVEVVHDFLPNIGQCVLQDYGRLNDSLVLAAVRLGENYPKEKS